MIIKSVYVTSIARAREEFATSIAHARVRMCARIILVLMGFASNAFAQSPNETSDSPWHVSANQPVHAPVLPYKIDKVGFPIYDIKKFCWNRGGLYCEQSQQSAYNQARYYWPHISSFVRQNSIKCVDAQERGVDAQEHGANHTQNYSRLLLCMDDAAGYEHQQEMADYYNHPQPFHY